MLSAQWLRPLLLLAAATWVPSVSGASSVQIFLNEDEFQHVGQRVLWQAAACAPLRLFRWLCFTVRVGQHAPLVLTQTCRRRNIEVSMFSVGQELMRQTEDIKFTPVANNAILPSPLYFDSRM